MRKISILALIMTLFASAIAVAAEVNILMQDTIRLMLKCMKNLQQLQELK
jgi:hypothetical protein